MRAVVAPRTPGKGTLVTAAAEMRLPLEEGLARAVCCWVSFGELGLALAMLAIGVERQLQLLVVVQC